MNVWKWEYDIKILPSRDTTKINLVMDEAGEEGWEVITCEHTGLKMDSDLASLGTRIVLKRPIAPYDPTVEGLKK